MKYSPPRPPSPSSPPPPADREPCTAAPRVARPSSDLSRFSTDLAVPSRSVPRGPSLRPVSPSPSRFRRHLVCAPRNILDYSPVTARSCLSENAATFRGKPVLESVERPANLI
nr:PREDICTED: vegetative cell wall protein gp1-like [Bemisia tabaci]